MCKSRRWGKCYRDWGTVAWSCIEHTRKQDVKGSKARDNETDPSSLYEDSAGPTYVLVPETAVVGKERCETDAGTAWEEQGALLSWCHKSTSSPNRMFSPTLPSWNVCSYYFLLKCWNIGGWNLRGMVEMRDAHKILVDILKAQRPL
jgi:hypothetical protein